tara:strand:+ start:524 stop:1492 length:969 start_codon:yes stop_codon:yes gene_type:complete
MNSLAEKQIINRNFDLIFIKFPIIFPIIYGTVLYLLPEYENILIFLTLLFLAEAHFGATWPFFLDKSNASEIKNNKLQYVIGPVFVVIFCLIGFFYVKNFFLLIFFVLNIFHVTRQSFGICKLYKKDEKELLYQENLIYIFNFLFFLIGFFRFYIPLINEENIFFINIIIFILLFFTFSFYLIKFKNIENFLTFVTGVIIFLPVCFVDKTIHAIVMGVTMHYTQYLVLTYKIYKKRKSESLSEAKSKFYFFRFKNYKFLLIILIYGLVMTLISSESSNPNKIFSSLLVIPITGQILHFYLDAFLWKFSVKHNREVTLKHIYN